MNTKVLAEYFSSWLVKAFKNRPTAGAYLCTLCFEYFIVFQTLIKKWYWAVACKLFCWCRRSTYNLKPKRSFVQCACLHYWIEAKHCLLVWCGWVTGRLFLSPLGNTKQNNLGVIDHDRAIFRVKRSSSLNQNSMKNLSLWSPCFPLFDFVKFVHWSPSKFPLGDDTVFVPPGPYRCVAHRWFTFCVSSTKKNTSLLSQGCPAVGTWFQYTSGGVVLGRVRVRTFVSLVGWRKARCRKNIFRSKWRPRKYCHFMR